MTSATQPFLGTKKSTVILIALCINLGLIYLLFCLQSSQQAFEQATVIMTEEPPTTQTSLAPHKETPEWGEMLARQGNFGIQTAPAAATSQEHDKEVFDTTVAKESHAQSIPTPEPNTAINPTTKSQKPTSLSAAISEQNFAQKNCSTKCADSEKSTPLQKTVQQNMPSVSKNKPLTLADIGQGFLAESRHNGTYGVTMEGKKGGRITDEQIKIERYVERLTWCLQNSLRLQRSSVEPLVRTELSVYVFLELERSGAISRLDLIKSCGSTQLDQQTLAVFKDAGSSFPPVPTYLTMTPFAIQYHVQYGTSSESPLRLSFSH